MARTAAVSPSEALEPPPHLGHLAAGTGVFTTHNTHNTSCSTYYTCVAFCTSHYTCIPTCVTVSVPVV